MPDMVLHFGPVYERPPGETMALCKPPGSNATMTNHVPAVTCGKCLDLIKSMERKP